MGRCLRLLALSCAAREEVDEVVARAVSAGKVFMLVLLVSASATDGMAQGTGTPSGDALRVTWQPRQYAVVPVIEGYVQNDTVFRVSSVRLRIEGFDGSGQSVGETSTWTFGTIAPGGRGHFVV